MERYRLGPLREVRSLDERAKRNDLAAAVGDARATAEEVAAAAARVEAARSVLAAVPPPVSGPAHAIAMAERYVARCRHLLDDAVAAHARAVAAHTGRQSVVDAARSKLTAARANKELIERHFARWREAQRKLADRRED